jgi:hypothetical protein
MHASFYDTSVATYLQTLRAVEKILEKGEEHATAHGMELGDLVHHRLREDMLPFSFQVVSVWHHSMGAIKGMEAGVFAPPEKLGELDYARLIGLVTEAIGFLEPLEPEAVNALSGKPMVFAIGGREIPFTTDNFLLSFSLPNFFFHATTAYAMLRQQGVPLGKMDFLGQMRVGQ